MTRIDVDYELMRIRILDKKINAKILQLEGLKMSLLPGAIRYDLDKVQSSPEDPMSRIFAIADSLEREIQELVREKQELILKEQARILRLSDEAQQTVLLLFYIGKLPMKEVARRMDYSERRAYQIRGAGLDALAAVEDHSS